MNNLFNLVFLGIATGAISMVVSRSAILNAFHAWVEKRSVFSKTCYPVLGASVIGSH